MERKNPLEKKEAQDGPDKGTPLELFQPFERQLSKQIEQIEQGAVRCQPNLERAL